MKGTERPGERKPLWRPAGLGRRCAPQPVPEARNLLKKSKKTDKDALDEKKNQKQKITKKSLIDEEDEEEDEDEGPEDEAVEAEDL